MDLNLRRAETSNIVFPDDCEAVERMYELQAGGYF